MNIFVFKLLLELTIFIQRLEHVRQHKSSKFITFPSCK